MPSPTFKPHQSALVAASIVSLVASATPLLRAFLLPLQYLNTHLHELSHATAATLSGGEVQHILVFANGSGVTPVSGGALSLIGPAGYVGASMIGAAMIYVGRTPDRARLVLRILAIVLAASMLLWVRGDLIGVISGISWTAALALASFAFRGNTALFTCQLLGLQQCLNALTSVYFLLKISAFTEQHSDAELMQEVTKIPAFIWALGWCVFSAVLVTITVRRAWAQPLAPSGRAG